MEPQKRLLLKIRKRQLKFLRHRIKEGFENLKLTGKFKCPSDQGETPSCRAYVNRWQNGEWQARQNITKIYSDRKLLNLMITNGLNGHSV